MPRQTVSEPIARLGYVVHVRRARLRITQDETARRAGMHRNYVGAIERGEINPTYETLLRLADGLDLPLYELIEEAETTTEIEPVQRRRKRGARSKSK